MFAGEVTRVVTILDVEYVRCADESADASAFDVTAVVAIEDEQGVVTGCSDQASYVIVG